MNVYEAIKTRRSVRAYTDTPIPQDIVQRLMESLRLAPSATNAQPWKFIFVTERGAKEALARACKGRMWIADAAVIVVGCGFPDQAYQSMGGQGSSLDIDLAIALDHLSLSARNEGIGACWIGAFIEQDVKMLLGVPPGVKVVSLMTLGYPADSRVFRADGERRKKLDEIISCEKY